MTRALILKEVLARMDEISELNTIDVLPNGVVDKLLDESAYALLMFAPASIVPLSAFTLGTVAGTNSAGVLVSRVKLPTDFVRIVRFQLTDWDRPAKLIDVDSPEYSMQFNEFTYGGKSRPVIALVSDPVDGLSLEFYRLVTDDEPTALVAQCVLKTSVENFAGELLTALFYFTAANAFQVYGMANEQTAAMNKVVELFKLRKSPVNN